MSLFKGLNRIAGQVTHTTTPEDVSDKQVVFTDDGSTSGYSDCQEIIDEMSSGNILSNLFAGVKRGLQYLNDKINSEIKSITNKFGSYYTSTQVDSKLSTKVNSTNSTLQWNLADGTETKYVQLRRAGSTPAYHLSAVVYDTEAETTVFNAIVNESGVFLPKFAYETASSSSITTSATNAWTNMRSIVLSAGTWFVEAQVDISGTTNAITGRLYAGSTEYGRQSVYCKDGNIYSARIGTMIKLNGNTTLYLQTWSTSSLTVNRTILTATRMR